MLYWAVLQYWLSFFMTYCLAGHPMVYRTDKKTKNEYYFWNKEDRPAKNSQPIVVFSAHRVIVDRHYKHCENVFRETVFKRNILNRMRLES